MEGEKVQIGASSLRKGQIGTAGKAEMPDGVILRITAVMFTSWQDCAPLPRHGASSGVLHLALKQQCKTTEYTYGDMSTGPMRKED